MSRFRHERLTEYSPKRGRYSRPTVLKAPEVFSLVREPEAAIDYINRVEAVLTGNSNIVFDLSNVKTLTIDAIAVLVSLLSDTRMDSRFVSGSFPKDPFARHLMVECGFLKRISTPYKSKNHNKNAYGDVSSKTDYQYAPHKPKKLLDSIHKQIPMGLFERDGCDLVIKECMNNTIDHATDEGETNPNKRERWWISVHCDTARQVARFCFFDTGLGIVKTLERRGLWPKLREQYQFKNRRDFMERLLRGDIQSSTLEPHRGNGLPNIAHRFKLGQIKKLVMVSNNQYADVDTKDFRRLTSDFSGTLIYWEHHA